MVPVRRSRGLPHAEYNPFQPAPVKDEPINQAGQREDTESVRKSSADTKVIEERAEGCASCAQAGAGIPLQPLEETMVKQMFPCNPK